MAYCNELSVFFERDWPDNERNRHGINDELCPAIIELEGNHVVVTCERGGLHFNAGSDRYSVLPDT